MLKWLTCLLTFAHAQDLPLWKVKDKLFERVKNGEVVVLVREAKVKSAVPNEKRLEIEGGGHVAASRSVVFTVAQRYEELPSFSDFIKSSKFNPATSLITLEVSAFGYATSMDVWVKAHQIEQKSELKYEVKTGPMAGLTGRVTMTELQRAKTEVGLEGEFKYTQFPLPQLFLEYGLEFAFRRLAWRLRTHAEQEHRKNERTLHP